MSLIEYLYSKTLCAIIMLVYFIPILNNPPRYCEELFPDIAECFIQNLGLRDHSNYRDIDIHYSILVSIKNAKGYDSHASFEEYFLNYASRRAGINFNTLDEVEKYYISGTQVEQSDTARYIGNQALREAINRPFYSDSQKAQDEILGLTIDEGIKLYKNSLYNKNYNHAIQTTSHLLLLASLALICIIRRRRIPAKHIKQHAQQTISN